MDVRLNKAIRNNNGLYEAVLSQFNISFYETEEIWYSLEKVHPYYSNIVTRSPAWQPDDIFNLIDTSSIKLGWDGWSIKDSFAVLDLTKYGFSKRFDAQWLYLESEKYTPIHDKSPQNYNILTSQEDLYRWRIAWDIDPRVGEQIFNPGLLKNPKIIFIAGYIADHLASGCVLNKTEEVLGISNFFSPSKDLVYWSSMLDYIFYTLGKFDIVGYERIDVVETLCRLGFQPVGRLVVWAKSKTEG